MQKIVLIVDDEQDRQDLLSESFKKAFGKDIKLLFAKNYSDARRILYDHDCTYPIDFISLDHDLGEEKTGYDVLREISVLVGKGFMKVNKIFIHTMNTVAAPRMLALAAEIPGVEVKQLKLSYNI